MAFSTACSSSVCLSWAQPGTSCSGQSRGGVRAQAFPPNAWRVNEAQCAGTRSGVAVLSKRQQTGGWGHEGHARSRIVSLQAQKSLTEVEEWGDPVSLGTATLPADVNLDKLGDLLFQWGNSLTQNANIPLPLPLKVDRVEGGVRLGYIKLTDGVVENLLHIDVTVSPAVGGGKPTFQAVRSGKYKTTVPPGEQTIMQSLLQALRKAVEIARS